MIHLNVFSNTTRVNPLVNTYTKYSNKSKYIRYYCKNCDRYHWIQMSNSILVDGEWVCKRSLVLHK